MVAKYDVIRACGHEEVVDLIGPGKNREWRLENIEPYRLCRECYEAEQSRKKAEENAKAADLAKEWELPALAGTEKQIAWAETIRTKLIEALEAAVIKHKPNPEKLEQLQEAIESIKGKSSASWWIDHRDIKGDWEILQLVVKEAELLEKNRANSPVGQHADALAEVTVRPEQPITETVAEIRAKEDSVIIIFPEKRDDFREVVKHQLGMEWSAGGYWRRELIYRNGKPSDRTAEVGHKLLATGFVIRIFDPEIREKAIAGTYEPECTRWVVSLVDGKYDGYLAAIWDREEDFYQAARRIHGSRWSKPYVVIPPENFDEVLDFAKMYDFQISVGAQRTIEKAREIRDNALVAKVESPARQSGTIAVNSIPPVLEVPDHVDIADEFKD